MMYPLAPQPWPLHPYSCCLSQFVWRAHTHKHNHWEQQQPNPRSSIVLAHLFSRLPLLSFLSQSLFSRTGRGCPFVSVQLGNANGKWRGQDNQPNTQQRRQTSASAPKNTLCTSEQQETRCDTPTYTLKRTYTMRDNC